MSLHPTHIEQLRVSLKSKDQKQLQEAMSKCLLRASSSEIEGILIYQLALMPRDVQDYWNGECDSPTTIQEDAIEMVRSIFKK